MPSFHQGDLFRAIAACEDVDLQVIFAKDLTPDRIALGWHSDLSGFSYRFLDERNRMADAMRLARAQRKRLHIVNGLWTEPAFAVALVTLALSESRYAIYSEAPDPNQPRSIIKRFLQYRFGRVLAPRATGTLAVSRLAARFFKSLKVRESRIYPFGYFRSLPLLEIENNFRSEDRIDVIFVGQLIHRKGVDLLLDAMRPLFKQYANLFLIIIGKGEMLDSIRQQAEAAGVIDRVVFEGALHSDKIPARMAAADVLVLPSRWDGWGMVVNEAFSVGAPVIVSDRCGAADLVRNSVNGYVFRSEDAQDLYKCLSDFLDRKSEWSRFRADSAATGKSISVEEAASYLVNCIKHMAGISDKRPTPPWAQSDAGHSTPCLNENNIPC